MISVDFYLDIYYNILYIFRTRAKQNMIKSNIPTKFPPVKIASYDVKGVWEGFLQTRGEKPEEISVLPRMLPAEFPKSIETQLFVSNFGSDDFGDGSMDRPFATLAYALERIGSNGGVIWLRGGTYHSTELTEKHSGTNDAPLFIMSYGDEKVTFVAGKSFTPDNFVALDSAAFVSAEDKRLFNTFKRHNSQNVYVADLARLGFVKSDFDAFASGKRSAPVYVGDTAYHVARYPNVREHDPARGIYNGRLFTMSTAKDAKNIRFTGKPTSYMSFLYQKHSEDEPEGWSLYIGDTSYVSHALRYRNVYDNLYIFGSVYEEWSNEPYRVRIENVEGEIVMNNVGETNYYGAKANGDAGFYFYNMPEDLDAEKEYLIDIEKMLLYVYGRPNATVTVATEDRPLLKVSGASYVVVNGISFKYAPKNGVVLSGTKEVFVQDCLFHGIDKTALCLDDTYMSGAIYNTFYGGEYSIVTSFNRAVTAPTCNVIQNNVFDGRGSSNENSVALFLNGGFGDVSSHNVFYDCGCFIAFEYDLVFEYNDMRWIEPRNVDTRMIYSHASSRGVHIRYNRLYGAHDKIFAIFLDDMSSGNYVYGNTVYFDKLFPSNRGIFLRNGQMNVVYNNMCILAGDGAIVNKTSYAPKIINGEDIGTDSELAHFWPVVATNFLSGAYHSVNESLMEKRYPMWAFMNIFNDRALAKAKETHGWSATDKIYPEEGDEIFVRMPGLNVYRNNISYRSKKGLKLPPYALDTCIVKDNLEYSEGEDLSFADELNADYTLCSESIVFTDLPSFEVVYPQNAGLTE